MAFHHRPLEAGLNLPKELQWYHGERYRDLQREKSQFDQSLRKLHPIREMADDHRLHRKDEPFTRADPESLGGYYRRDEEHLDRREDDSLLEGFQVIPNKQSDQPSLLPRDLC